MTNSSCERNAEDRSFGQPAHTEPAAEALPRPSRRLPNEARDGLMRAWLEILRARHPGVQWTPVERGSSRAYRSKTNADSDG